MIYLRGSSVFLRGKGGPEYEKKKKMMELGQQNTFSSLKPPGGSLQPPAP